MKVNFFVGSAIAVAIFLSCVLYSSTYADYTPLGKPTLKPGENIRHEIGIVNGLTVDRYTWRDSKARPRSASLVQYGQGPRGGYANQFTFQVFNSTTNRWRTIYIDPPDGRSDAGFGYFVSHELYRYFDAKVCGDGSNHCTIAELHGQDDSPLGMYLPGTGKTVAATDSYAIHRFRLNYPHWGTTNPMSDPSGYPNKVPSNPNSHVKYNLPAIIRWKFLSGHDYPLWSVVYNLSAAPENTVSVDMRGPYGYMNFDPSDGRLTKLEWGDQYKFATKGTSVSTVSNWTWNKVNSGARYNLLVAGAFEMGLVQSIPYSQSRSGSGWASARGSTSAAGDACPDEGWRMPCDWQWTYQSIQYENFDANPSSMKKIAWGTAPYMGTGLTSDDTGQPFVGYPKVSYKVWITFDRSGGANTRNLAASIH